MRTLQRSSSRSMHAPLPTMYMQVKINLKPKALFIMKLLGAHLFHALCYTSSSFLGMSVEVLVYSNTGWTD